MQLKQEIQKFKENKIAIGHFNISNFEMLKGVFSAVQDLSKNTGTQVPVIIGLSENERKYLGAEQIIAFILNLREKTDYPIFINADHCHSYESAEDAMKAGVDAVVLDNSKFSLSENIEMTKKTVAKLKEIYPDILIEGEIGFIGGSSKLLDEIPSGAEVTADQITKVEEAVKFVKETNIDLLAPAVGNIHGVLKNFLNPSLHIQRIKEIADSVTIPLVLHGGSGIAKEEVKDAVKAGVVIVHFSTDLRVAYRAGLQELFENYFPNHPNEVAPYKYMQLVAISVQKAVSQRLKLLN
ncbi:MAG: class II fructose-bisphosphate aldolase [Patescibacteria group bacterium]